MTRFGAILDLSRRIESGRRRAAEIWLQRDPEKHNQGREQTKHVVRSRYL
jgi:hypothetical protein